MVLEAQEHNRLGQCQSNNHLLRLKDRLKIIPLTMLKIQQSSIFYNANAILNSQPQDYNVQSDSINVQEKDGA